MAENIYTKSKASVDNLNISDVKLSNDAFKVGMGEGAEQIFLEYMTKLYSSPEIAIIRELFTNACDASAVDEPVKITFECDGDNTYAVTVTDLGCGMSDAQLRENYITYISSGKKDDLSQVGSFGLGSKSPMALVSEYTVISSNGKEKNTYVVARTDKGFFADRVAHEDGDFPSFTKVFFGGLDAYNASAMYRFSKNYIETFSKHAVVVESELTPAINNNFDTLECGEYKSFPLTMYGTNIKLAAARFVTRNVSESRVLVRINDIVYPLFDDYKDELKDYYLVIDVEPGYFSFAPNRESLPSGPKKEHLISIIRDFLYSSRDVNEEYPLLKKVLSDDEIINFYKKEKFVVFQKDGSYGCDTKKLKVIKNKQMRKNIQTFIETVTNSKHLDYDTDKVDIISYKKNGWRKVFNTEKHLNKDALNDKIEECAEYNATRGDRYSRCRVITDVKFNKNNEAIIPSAEYRVKNISKEYTTIARNQGVGGGYYRSGDIEVHLIFVKKGYTLSEEVLFTLSVLNETTPNKIEAIQVENYRFNEVIPEEVHIVKSTTRRPCTRYNGDMGDKIIIARTFDNLGKGWKQKASDLAGDGYFVHDVKKWEWHGDLLNLVAYVTGKPVYKVSDKTKSIKKYLEENNCKFIDIDANDALINEYDRELNLVEATMNSGIDMEDTLKEIILDNQDIFQYGIVKHNGFNSIHCINFEYVDWLTDVYKNNKSLFKGINCAMINDWYNTPDQPNNLSLYMPKSRVSAKKLNRCVKLLKSCNNWSSILVEISNKLEHKDCWCSSTLLLDKLVNSINWVEYTKNNYARVLYTLNDILREPFKTDIISNTKMLDFEYEDGSFGYRYDNNKIIAKLREALDKVITDKDKKNLETLKDWDNSFPSLKYRKTFLDYDNKGWANSDFDKMIMEATKKEHTKALNIMKTLLPDAKFKEDALNNLYA